MYALVDCANFFVSCERVFQPHFNRKPVVVLSSNDGCAIARSEEAKALGVLMGAPLFTFQDLVKKHSIQLFSSNFVLYGDMSRRVLSILRSFSPQVYPYSVDESFVVLSHCRSTDEAMVWGRAMRQRILQWTGIPTRVGIGPTKTLAKLANAWAKKSEDGVMYLDQNYSAIFEHTPAESVWGIGRRMSKRLAQHGIVTAQQFKDLPDAHIRQMFTVMGLRTAHELRGRDCYLAEGVPEEQKSMLISRSFGQPITERERLKQTIAVFVTRLAEKLRAKKLKTNSICVFIRTSKHRHDHYESQAATIPLLAFTHDTITLIQAAHHALEQIYKPNLPYKKAGIYCGELQGDIRQDDLFENGAHPNRDKLFTTLDQVNRKYGRGTVKLASCGVALPTQVYALARQELLSPRYTTEWSDLLAVK